MTLAHYIVAVLAGWRLASLLVFEDGPFDVFFKLRYWLTPPGELTGVGKMLSCLWCTSVWTAIVCYFGVKLWALPFVLLAISAVVIIIEQTLIRRDK